MYLRTDRWKNGDGYTPVPIYICDHCLKEVCSADPHNIPEENVHYCWDCSFIKGLISDKEFLQWNGYGGFSMLKAAVKDGKIYVWTSKFAPWETPDKEYRKTKAYREWRNQVFERDKHTCRNCGTTDNLQAHHIKPFAKYVKLRFKLSNGLTLCEKCHREVHKKNPKKVSG